MKKAIKVLSYICVLIYSEIAVCGMLFFGVEAVRCIICFIDNVKPTISQIVCLIVLMSVGGLAGLILYIVDTDV